MRLRNAALAYAARGWAVFPLKPGTKVPAVQHGVKEATTDSVQVGAWWDRMPGANIGMACGDPSDLWVLDVDGQEGEDSLLAFGHGFPATLTQYTPSGGLHFVFRHMAGLGNTAGSIGAKLDSRGDGGYIVVAPSVVNGREYRWAGKVEPQPIPGWLLTMLRKPPVERKPITATERSGYAGKAVTLELAAVACAVEGTRNHTLNRAAWNLGTLVGAGLLGMADVRGRLIEAAVASGLPEPEATATVDRGLRDGQAHPREVQNV
jgi:hypothetical protein